MRTGVMQYPCNTGDPNCKEQSTPDFSVAAGNPHLGPDQLLVTVQPSGLTALDLIDDGNGTCLDNGTCTSPGANPNVANIGGANPNAIFEGYPHPNSDSAGDFFDYRGYTFAAANPTKLMTYIFKLDYKLTQSGNQSLFAKGHLENFRGDGSTATNVAQFPGQPPNDFLTNNSKGILAGYTALITPTLVNNLRYGYIRQGLGDGGLSDSDYNHFRGMTDVHAFTNSVFTNVPVHNIVDDLSWTKGKHTLQFGANLRIIKNNRLGNSQNVSFAETNVFWLAPAGISGTCTALDPASLGNTVCGNNGPYPSVDPAFGVNYDFAMAALAGLLTETNKVYNQDKTGHFYAPGQLIQRNFKSTESEFYAQDAWRVTPNLVLTGGLRYSLLQPPFEVNGNEVAPSVSLNDWFNKRSQAMSQGLTYHPTIAMNLSGQANGKAPYWAWDYKNVAPRLAFAYSPHSDNGLMRALFGAPGKSSIRGGYGIYYDHFGEGIVNSFDKNGSFGLTSALTNPAGSQDVGCTPRLTDLTTLPDANTTFCGQQVVGPPPAQFPNTVIPPGGTDAGSFAIYWGLDDKLKTPYSHVIDFSITRELARNFVMEVSYVGRFAHHLLQEEDLAMPLDLVDPASKMDYFKAATMLTQNAVNGTDIAALAPIPFWEHMWPQAAGKPGFGLGGGGGCAPNGGGLPSTAFTATQAMYDLYSCFSFNETSALFYADLPQGFNGNDCAPACSTVNGNYAPFNVWDDQFSSLYAWRSTGSSAYHALQLTLRKSMSSGLQFDVNYTFSKAIDVGSNAERINEFEGFGFASQVINSWSPGQLRALADFDTTHQLNSNWVYELPFGKGRRFASGMGKFANGALGGWGVSGILHWTSGLPWTMGSGAGWSTNWQLEGQAIETANPGKVGVYRSATGDPIMWKDVSTTGQAYTSFRFPYPGESGQRNNLRGPGFFELDDGLWKSWNVTESKTVKFAWEVFNVTNAVRFDAAGSAFNFNLTGGNFGTYGNTLTKPRVMQFSLRFDY